MTERMWYNSTFLARSWSLIVVFAIFGLVLSGMLLSEPGRAVASVLCMALLMQSWVTQRRYAKSRERLVLLTLALGIPALASLWLGLNVLRFYSYAPESRAHLYSAVVRLQEIIQSVAYAIGLVVPLNWGFHHVFLRPTSLTDMREARKQLSSTTVQKVTTRPIAYATL